MKIFQILFIIFILLKFRLSNNHYIGISEVYKSDTKYFCSIYITNNKPKDKVIIKQVKIGRFYINSKNYFDAEVIQTETIEIILKRNENINLFKFLWPSLTFELVTIDKTWQYTIQTQINIDVYPCSAVKQFKTGERKFELILQCYFPIQNNGFHVYNNKSQNLTQNFKFDILKRYGNYFLLEVEVLEDFNEINLNVYLSSDFNIILSLQLYIVQNNEIVASKKNSFINVLLKLN